MHYVISDIHGEIEKYRTILERIQFNSNDELYILGDAIDRHPHGIDIIKDIMSRPNAHMILGNHEQMCINDIIYHEPGARELWTRTNGGSVTRRNLIYKTSKEDQAAIRRFLISLPDFMEINIKGMTVHMVHGWPGDCTDDRVWERPNFGDRSPFADKVVIIGHTPTPYLQPMSGPYHIVTWPGVIAIDCGCGNQTDDRRLACICLETMQEFYA